MQDRFVVNATSVQYWAFYVNFFPLLLKVGLWTLCRDKAIALCFGVNNRQHLFSTGLKIEIVDWLYYCEETYSRDNIHFTTTDTTTDNLKKYKIDEEWQYFGCFWHNYWMPSVLWRCWLGIRKGIRPIKSGWWCTGMVICLERIADDLHMVQLMPLPLIISCFIKIRNGSTFLLLAYQGCFGNETIKWV